MPAAQGGEEEAGEDRSASGAERGQEERAEAEPRPCADTGQDATRQGGQNQNEHFAPVFIFERVADAPFA